MRRTLLIAVAVAAGLCVARAESRAGGPELGFNAGAMVPLSKFQRAVNKNVGGTFGFMGGYRFDLSDTLALSLVAQPQFFFYDTQDSSDDAAGMFMATAGPKLSIVTGDLETYITAQGGYYRDIVGPLSDDGWGFNAGGGVGYRITEADTIGVNARYDYTLLDAAADSDTSRQFVLTGFHYTHVFLPEPPPKVVPAPPPPPGAARPRRSPFAEGSRSRPAPARG